MDARFYGSEDVDIERLAVDILNVYLAQGYQAQQLGNKSQVLVQLKKGGDFEAILGMQAAVTLTLQRTTGGVLAMIGQQRWIDKAAVGTVGLAFFPVLWPLALTAGAGAIRQASLGNQVLNVVDGLVRQQQPLVQVGPVPAQMLPQIQQQWGQPPAQIAAPYYVPSNAATGGELRCTQCNTPYGPGDTFCSGCGRALAAPRQYCSNCNSELKAGVAFCPKCGASAFQSTTTVAAAPAPRPAPVVQAPAYVPPTPVKPAPPVYTPPVAPTPPYVPPTPQAPASPPPTQVYYVPSNAQPTVQEQSPRAPEVYYVPSNAQPTVQEPPRKPDVYYVPANAQPTVEDQPAPKKPEVPYYVPPEQMKQAAPPQPRVTIVPAAPAHEPPPPQKPHPQKQYYIPSHQAGVDALSASATGDAGSVSSVDSENELAQATLPASTVPASAEPTLPDVPATAPPGEQWGSLTFSNGTVLALTGERAVVGRYDHDLGGVHPEIDLGEFDGADTVSRVHAAFEHTSGAFLLTDLNSTNATRINGKRLTPDTPTSMHDGDALQFGKVAVTFKAGA